MPNQNNHPKRDLMIYCWKCLCFVWHTVIDLHRAVCLNCGDEKDLSDPSLRIGEINNRGKREKRI